MHTVYGGQFPLAHLSHRRRSLSIREQHMTTSELIAELKKRVESDYADNSYDYDNLAWEIRAAQTLTTKA